MKRKIYIIASMILVAGIMTTAAAQKNTGKKSTPDNTLSKKEQKQGWVLLFDGQSTGSWMNARTKTFPQGGWVVENGTLAIKPGSKGGDIVTRNKFRNFELTIDFNYTPGANSGIKYFIDTEVNDGRMASIGCEYQVLDNKLHPDAKAGINGNRTLSSLYDLIPATNVKDNGPNQWNTARIVVNGNKVQHWLNGQLTVEYERGSEAWKDYVSKSKFKGTKGFAETTEGRILLQDHGDAVAYRNIRIREIK